MTERRTPELPAIIRKDALGPDDIVANMSVVHPRFGEGRVLKVEKIGGDALVCVDFEGMTKNMLCKQCGA